MSDLIRQLSNATVEEENNIEEDGGEAVWLTSFGDLMSLLLVFFIILMSASNVSAIKYERMKNSFSGKTPENHIEISKVANNVRKKVKDMGIEQQVAVVEDIDHIDLILKDSLLFKSGKADLMKENRLILDQIIESLKELPDYARITIEGHTDDAPIHTNLFQSNWALSSARALAVLKEFERQKFPSKRLSIRGYGEFDPILPNRNEDGSPNLENRSLNRRVVIKIY